MARRSVLAVACALVLAAASAGSALPAPAPLPGGVSVVAPDGAWTWFTEPRAVRHQGVTYAAWISSTGDVVVGAHDAERGTLRTRVLMPGFEVDDHDNPALLLRPDGRLTAFWSAHNGRRMFHRTSLRVGSVDAWGPLRVLPVNLRGERAYTYANPVVLSEERHRTYLFWRAGRHDQAFSTSSDQGASWTPARALVRVPGQRPYVKYATDGRRTIAMALTDGHPAEAHTSVYAMTYRGGWLRRPGGAPIARLADAPVAPAQADLVYRARPGEDAWVHDVALDHAGRVVVVFATTRGAGAHAYWYAAHDGRRWAVSAVVGAGDSISAVREPHYSAGIALDHDDPRTLYLSRPVDGEYEVERWTTPDGGRSWTTTAVTAGSAQDNLRPAVPRGPAHDGGPSVLWLTGRYDHYTAVTTGIAADVLLPPPGPAPTELTAAVVRTAGGVRIEALLEGVGGLAPVPGAEVTVQARQPGRGPWVLLAQGTTGSDGRVAVDLGPRPPLDYRVVWPGDVEWARSTSGTAAG